MLLIHYPGYTLTLLSGSSLENSANEEVVTAASVGELRILVENFGAGKRDQTVLLSWEAQWPPLLREVFPTVIETGGGLVENGQGEILLIRRLGHWDLPKGKLDAGESYREAALREVAEETGVTPLVPGPSLGVSYHTYHHDGGWVLKENHWFEMKTDFHGLLSPQVEEDIERCVWADPWQVDSFFEEMYPAVRTVIERFRSARRFDIS